MRFGLLIISILVALPAMADVYNVNFRSEIGPLPKTAKQRLEKTPDFSFKAESWDEAIHTGQTWLGSERRTSVGSVVLITGVELREANGRHRACVLGDMSVAGVQPCPKPAWQGSPILQKNKRNPAGRR